METSRDILNDLIINGELEGCETNRMINLLSPSTIVLGRTVYEVCHPY